MNAEQRTRVYCCFKACPMCGAQRGEYCVSKGKRWTKSYHWQRGPFAQRSFRTGLWKAERIRYAKLKAQIELSGEIPGHE